MEQKILVTGATGFIGTYVVCELLSRGINVIATSSSEEVAKCKEWFNEVKYIPFNILEFNSKINYFSFFNQPDRVIHLAWGGLSNFKEEFHIAKNFPYHKAF